jgi:hypothetical protein
VTTKRCDLSHLSLLSATANDVMRRQEERSTTNLQVLNHLRVDDDVNLTLHTELLPLKAPEICLGHSTQYSRKGAIASGGGRGIRTPGAVNPAVFKTAAIDHSAIPPLTV